MRRSIPAHDSALKSSGKLFLISPDRMVYSGLYRAKSLSIFQPLDRVTGSCSMAKHQGAELRETTEDRPEGDFYGTVSKARISLQRTRGVLHPAGIQVHPKRSDEKVEVPALCLQLLKKFWCFDRFLTDQAELVKLIL